jgi:DNA-binding response OmpR family regulator
VTETHIRSNIRDESKAAAPRILVVEDQEIIQDLLLTIFGHEGFEARIAGTVAEALAALVNCPDFVVLDLHLPDGRGTQVLREIRERDIPAKVAVTTGTIDASLMGAADRLHPDKFFHKPYRAMELVTWIRSWSPSTTSAQTRQRAAS